MMADETTTQEQPEVQTEAQQEAQQAPVEQTEAEKPAAAEPFVLDVPEGMEAFKGDFEAFSSDMDAWLKANPAASAREALAEAASRQARVASEKGASLAKDSATQVAAWADELKSDKEFGGSGYDGNIALAVKGVEAVGSPALRQLLDETGLGNHPDMVRAFRKVGQLVADAPFATGAQPPQQAKDLGARMYPNMTSGKD